MILIKNGLILTMDQKNRIIERGDILIQGDSILALGPSGSIPYSENDIEKVIDASDHLIMPGLINAHNHSQSALTKMAVSGDKTNTITALWYGFAHSMNRTSREIYLSAQINALQMLKTGCTTAIDQFMFSGLPTLSEIDNISQAYIDSGMRVNIAIDLLDKSQQLILPKNAKDIPALAKDLAYRQGGDVEDLTALYNYAAKQWHGTGEGRIKIVPSTPQPSLCSDKLLMRLLELAQEYDTVVTCHMLEHVKERRTNRDLWGNSGIKHLNDLGFFNSRLNIAHSIWVTDEEIKIMADSGVSVAHCPELNIRLGGGVAPVRAMLDSGINVALGADSATNQIMFEVMKLAGLVHRIGKTNPKQWIYADELLNMATVNGAKALGLTKLVGSLESGKKADIITLQLISPWLSPLTDIHSRLVYSENGSSVDTVIINGNIVMENRIISTFNEREVLIEAQSCFEDLKKRNKHIYDLAGQMADLVNPEIQEFFKEEKFMD